MLAASRPASPSGAARGRPGASNRRGSTREQDRRSQFQRDGDERKAGWVGIVVLGGFGHILPCIGPSALFIYAQPKERSTLRPSTPRSPSLPSPAVPSRPPSTLTGTSGPALLSIAAPCSPRRRAADPSPPAPLFALAGHRQQRASQAERRRGATSLARCVPACRRHCPRPALRLTWPSSATAALTCSRSAPTRRPDPTQDRPSASGSPHAR